VKSLLESTVDSEAAIGELRRQKVESKFYHIKSKVLPKQMKKVKVFLTQRVVKKIKQKKIGEEGKSEDVKELESELVKIKSLDHVKLAIWAFSSQILKDEYLRGKMVELGITENAASLEFEEIDRDKISSIKCFQDAIKTCRNDLIIFMRKLLHEAIPEPVKMAEKEPVERKMSSNKLSLSVDKSFFMDSLNADESDIELKDNSDIEGRVAFTDDEDDENGSGYFDSEVEEEKPKRKKNRLGQLARRRLAEKMYGREAKHIKSGGLTVQQKEELRKQNSQQKKERAARIKKDAAKFENLKKKKVDDESVSEFKKVASIKIDPKMHPSWAAKLQQQAKAQQATFQGQKIKFDE
jgi:hypothetical protein